MNPTDDTTRGLNVFSLTANSRWISGPEFLYLPEQCWPQPPCTLPTLPEEFSILRKTVNLVKSDVNLELLLNDRFARFSSWYRLRHSVAWILRLKRCLLKQPISKGQLTVDELDKAERAIIQCVQCQTFAKEINELLCDSKTCVHKSSPLRKLNPVMFKGILRVGGQLDRTLIPFEVKHHVILPSQHHATKLIIRDHHQSVGHSGMSHTWASLRQRYWILRGASTVRSVLRKCPQCKRRNAKAGQQMMSKLPECRLPPSNPPFYFTGIDYFGETGEKQRKVLGMTLYLPVYQSGAY